MFGPTVFQRRAKLQKAHVCFAVADVINKWKKAEIRAGHPGFKIGASHHNRYLWVSALDQPCQAHAGHGLLKGAGESHNVILRPVAAFQAELKKFIGKPKRGLRQSPGCRRELEKRMRQNIVLVSFP